MARGVGIQKLGCLSALGHYFIFYSLFLPVLLLNAGVGLGAMDEASASSPAPMEPGVILQNYGKAVVGLAYPEPILQEMEKTPPSGEIFAPEERVKSQRTLMGSGFIIDPQGIIVTNYHVIQRGLPAWAGLVDGRKFTGLELLDFDTRRDIALLKIHDPPLDLPTAPLGDSSGLKQGDRIYAIGNPLGFENSISDGLVAGIRETAAGTPMIQITAPISPGSSGGAVFDSFGRVIGISTLSYVRGQNLNFAVPISDIQKMFQPPEALPTVNGEIPPGAIVVAVLPALPRWGPDTAILPDFLVNAQEPQLEETAEDFSQILRKMGAEAGVSLVIPEVRTVRRLHPSLPVLTPEPPPGEMAEKTEKTVKTPSRGESSLKEFDFSGKRREKPKPRPTEEGSPLPDLSPLRASLKADFILLLRAGFDLKIHKPEGYFRDRKFRWYLYERSTAYVFQWNEGLQKYEKRVELRASDENRGWLGLILKRGEDSSRFQVMHSIFGSSGVKEGDELTSVEGKEASITLLTTLEDSIKPGDTLKIKVLREGQEQVLKVSPLSRARYFLWSRETFRKSEDAEKQAKDLFTPRDAGYKYGHNYMASLQFFYPWYAIRIFQTLFGDSSAFAVL